MSNTHSTPLPSTPLDDSIARLIARPKFGSGIGLHRMAAVLQPLLAGPWGRDLDSIKITGSNGKGSVSRLTAGILGALGLRTGLYTSPHLYRFHDRIVCDGEPIPDGALSSAIDWLDGAETDLKTRWPDEHMGAFEAFTAIAMRHYATRLPDALVLEVGIGGRLDAIRPVPGDIVGLTSVDLEHTDILGNSLELIAYDKADLCPDGGILVTGELAPALRHRVAGYAGMRRIALSSWRDWGALHSVRLDGGGMIADLTIDGVRLEAVRYALLGRHQIVNTLTAVGLVRQWLDRHRPDVSPAMLADAVRQAVGTVRWPGRLEKIADTPPVYIDVGHTPEAMGSTLAALPSLAAGRKVLMLCGVSYNKNADGIIAQLAPHADAMIATSAHHRSGDAGRIVEAAARHRPGLPVTRIDDLTQAVHAAMERAATADMVVMVLGGLFLAVEAATIVRGEDVTALRFF